MYAFAPNSPLSPDQFAGLSSPDQQNYLVSEAQYYQAQAANGASITQAQADFVKKMLTGAGVNTGSVAGNPDMNVGFLETAVSDVAESVGTGLKSTASAAGSSIGGFEIKVFLPIIIVAVVAIFLMNSYGKNVAPSLGGK